MSAHLAGRVALVTGAGRGIGRAIAVALAADGAHVVVNFRRDGGAADEVVASVRASGGTATAWQADVSDPGAVEAMVGGVVDAHGPVDLLVHNAGMASRGLGVADTDRSEVVRLLDAHAVAAHHLTRLVLPGMHTRERGDVVVISSTETFVDRPGSAPYAMAKCALEAFARILAAEEREHGVRVNIVAPGLVRTDMGERLARAVTAAGVAPAAVPFGRACTPEDVAGIVRFLVSPGAEYVTGQRIVVDGGEPDAAAVGAALGAR